MLAKFQDKISRATEHLEKIDGEPKEDMLDLAQIKSNLQFIGSIQDDEPPFLDSEAKKLTEQKGDLEGGHEVFTKLVADLKEVLRVSPAPTNMLKELNDGEPI